jgi:alpha-tubulin suppressor-like RCC1 family protein
LALQGCFDSSAENPRTTQTLAEATAKPTPPASGGGGNTTTPEPVTGFKALGVGENHSCAIKKIDSSLWCWGQNTGKQLGDGSVEDKSTPISIGTTQTWALMEGGAQNTCALDTKNNLYCWGSNKNGEVGNNTINNTTTDTPVTATLIGTLQDTWRSLALGNKHTCTIKSDYTLWCWGSNADGQLGQGAAVTPVLIPTQTGISTDWIAISANGDHTCGIRHVTTTSNTLWCWGKNDRGQLGVGDTATKNTPTQVGTDTDWNAISTGGEHTCGIRHESAGGGLFNDKLYCWGDNKYGQLGKIIPDPNGADPKLLAPTQIGTDTTWSSVSSGGQHTCAIKLDNTLWCWGNSVFGQIGVGVTAPVATPQKVASSVGVKTVASGASHTCAININDKLSCWGLNIQGQLGLGLAINATTPTNINPLAWKQVDSGADHTCGILDDNNLENVIYCGGLNQYGQLGDGTVQSRAAMIEKLSMTATQPAWKQLSTGAYHTCAIQSNKSLWCWGSNQQYWSTAIPQASSFQLGKKNVVDGGAKEEYTNWQPEQVGVLTDWAIVSAGGAHTCAINDTGKLYCWGENSSGQLGDNNKPTNNATPQEVCIDTAGPPCGHAANWSSLSAGDQHTCAIKNNTLWCWGKNNKGQLGDKSTTDRTIPTEVCIDSAVTCAHATDWIKVSSGGLHTCGIRHNVITGADTLWCWGDDTDGQLGNSKDHGSSAIPFPETDSNSYWIDVVASDNHTCGARQDGNDPNRKSVLCWGKNDVGQSGAGNKSIESPTQVITNIDWQPSSIPGTSMLALGKQTSCGFRATSGAAKLLYCWGDGFEYQLGDGRGFKATPTLVPLE